MPKANTASAWQCRIPILVDLGLVLRSLPIILLTTFYAAPSLVLAKCHSPSLEITSSRKPSLICHAWVKILFCPTTGGWQSCNCIVLKWSIPGNVFSSCHAHGSNRIRQASMAPPLAAVDWPRGRHLIPAKPMRNLPWDLEIGIQKKGWALCRWLKVKAHA